MKNYFIKLALSFVLFTACIFTVHADKDWTFMVYLDADNDLESFGIKDFIEMASVGSDANVRILVMMDRIPGYDTSYGDWTYTKRGLVNKDDLPDGDWGESMGEMDMGDPDTLRDFIIWGTQNYPAKKYAIVLWNHGDGWRTKYVQLLQDLKNAETEDEKVAIGTAIETLLKENSVSPELQSVVDKQFVEDVASVEGVPFGGWSTGEGGITKSVCWDETNNSHLNTKDVQEAILAAYTTASWRPRMAIVGFDACQMGMVEVAYQLRPSKSQASVMIGSEDNEPGDGWPYQAILADLVNNPAYTDKQLATVIVEQYFASYPSTAVTLCAVDLTKIDALAITISDLAAQMIQFWDDPNQKSAIRGVAATVKNKYDAAIVKSLASSAGAYGLTINFPRTGADIDYISTNIDFAQSSIKWRDFLGEFPIMTGSWIDDARTATGFIGNYYDIYGFVSNLVGPYDYTVDPITLIIQEEGNAAQIDLVLDVLPDSDVTITATIIDNKPVASEANAEVIGIGEVTFTTANWDTPQSIFIKGVSDQFAGDDTCRVKFEIKTNSDPNFTHLLPKYTDVTVVSDELAEIRTDKIILSINERAPGNTDTFEVWLAGKPRGNVSVAVQSLDIGEATASPFTLNFTTNSYDSNSSQTVTVTAVPDNFVGSDVVDIQMSVKTAINDPAYVASPNAIVTVTCVDDSGQTADYTVDPLLLNVLETGGTDTFSVVLNGRPHNNVKINMVSSDITKAKVSPASFTFTTDNWDVLQIATVTGIDDDLVGDSTVSINLSIDPSSDSHFVTTDKKETVVVNIISEDIPGFKISKTTLKMSENSVSKTFDIVLLKGPAQNNVVLDITAVAIGTSGVTGDVTVNQPTVTYNSTNWNIPQTVTVTSVPDFRLGNKIGKVKIEPNVALTYPPWITNAGPPIVPLAQDITVTLINDDVAGFTLTPAKELFVKENTNENYTIVLNAEPADGEVVKINAISSDIAEVTLTGLSTAETSVSFNKDDWNIPRNIQVNGVVDQYATDDTANIVNTIDTSSDPDFLAVKKQTIAVTVRNDNAINSAEITLSVNTLVINELAPGNTGTFTVMLDAKPHSNVLVDVTSMNTVEATIDTPQLTFTTSNWNIPQTVTVTSVNNNFLGDGTCDIRMRVKDLGSDPTFAPAADKTVTTTITENDPADAGGLTATETAIVVRENKGKKEFYISLTARPRTDVVVDLVSSDLNIAEILPTQVTFTTKSWNTQKKIKVIGDPNNNSIAIDFATITLTPSGDAAWMAARNPDPAPIAVTVTRDTDSLLDVAPLGLSFWENTVPPEAPGSGVFNVVLTKPPTGNVFVNIVSANNATATVDKAQLTFTTADWYLPQTVTVTNAAGDIVGDAYVNITCSIDAATVDPVFKTVANLVVQVTVRDLNPLASSDKANAITNRPTMLVANEPVNIRVLNNDSDPRETELTIKSVSGATGGVVAINTDQKTIDYTAPGVIGTYTFTYIATNSLAYNADSPATTVTVTVYEGQQVAYGSIVDLYATEVGLVQFTKRPALSTIYEDPWSMLNKNYTLKNLTKTYPTTGAKVENEFKRSLKLYNRSALSKAYKAGISFEEFTGQKQSVLFNVSAIVLKAETAMAWKLLLRPPVITAVKRFTTPQDDLDAPTALWAKDLHAGSIVHVLGNYFGNKTPKVWLEYPVNGAIKRANCKVLKYKNPAFLDSNEKTGYMDVQPTSATYSDSELKVMFPKKWPSKWPYGAFTLIVDNGVGIASFAGLSGGVRSSADSNDAPVAVADIFDGANQGAKVTANTKKNELDILNNDEFPNADEVKVTFVGKPDHKGKVRWDKSKAKIIYTPAKDFGAVAEQVEVFTYRITEKYTDQKLSSTATVTVTVEP